MERKLATVRIINALEPIPGYDRVLHATVDGWKVIVAKDDFKVGDKCVYIEIDSICPQVPVFEFLAKRHYKVKSIRMCKVISQGLCMPLSSLGISVDTKEHTDLTEKLGITKYDPEAEVEKQLNTRLKHSKLVQFLLRFRAFRFVFYLFYKNGSKSFPSFISKTDQERLQNRPDVPTKYAGRTLTCSEKLDGQSVSFILVPDGRTFFGKQKWTYIVCSRNLQVNETGNSTYAFCSKKYNMKNKMIELYSKIASNSKFKATHLAIQGEILAPTVQGNKYAVSEPELHVFHLIVGTTTQNYKLGNKLLQTYCDELGLTTVPMLKDYTLPETPIAVSDIIELSKINSTIQKDAPAEGIVYNVEENGFVVDSFKAINPEFLLKWDL